VSENGANSLGILKASSRGFAGEREFSVFLRRILKNETLIFPLFQVK